MGELRQDIKRLMNLAFPTAPTEVRETLAKEKFVDAFINSDIRLKMEKARLTNLTDVVRHAVELETFYHAERRQKERARSTIPEKVSPPSHDIETSTKSVARLESMFRLTEPAIAAKR